MGWDDWADGAWDREGLYMTTSLFVLQANDFLTVSVRLVGGNLISDCPKCDHRAMIGAKRGSDLEQAFPNNCTVPVASLCPHERMAVLLVLAQEAKLEGRVPDLGV